jgi:hypothetical protein
MWKSCQGSLCWGFCHSQGEPSQFQETLDLSCKEWWHMLYGWDVVAFGWHHLQRGAPHWKLNPVSLQMTLLLCLTMIISVPPWRPPSRWHWYLPTSCQRLEMFVLSTCVSIRGMWTTSLWPIVADSTRQGKDHSAKDHAAWWTHSLTSNPAQPFPYKWPDASLLLNAL